ncbi:metallopeptidase TldD-related protein [Sphaerisporangium sp. NPDC088356]|uniref:metallopeptidase TldD-related protein n=1 Tax=Sphaerisporangium sp. NPDC088356 TaxID=3154871 RepID=UPI003430764A
MSTLAERVAEIGAAAAAHADHWEVLGVDRVDTVVEVGSGVPDAVRSAHEAALCLRVHRAGRVGTVTTTGPDDAGALVRHAVRSAAYGPPASPPARPSPAPGRSPAAEPADDGEGGAARAVRRLAEGLGALQSAVGLTMHGTVSRTEQTVHRMAPEGHQEGRDRFFHVSALAEGAGTSGIQLPWNGWTRSAALPAGLASWLSTAAGWAGLPVLDAPSREHDVLLAPTAVHTLLTPLVTALSGTAAVSGRSFAAAGLGVPLLHTSISLRDHPSPPPAGDEEGTEGLAWPGSDDDGVPCAPLTLIDSGVPARLYHSHRTAVACGDVPTGHGFRGNALRRTMLRPITPVLNGATLSAEDSETGRFDDLLGGVRDGVLIESLMGGQQRGGLSPIVEGRIRLGFLIRHGRVAGVLHPCAVALDLREVLGARFLGLTEHRWAVSRIWSGRMPFVLASAGGGRA